MSVELNATNFPDDGWRRSVAFSFDTDKDGILSDAEIASAKIYNQSQYSPVVLSDAHGCIIRNLKGIEFLTELEVLQIDDSKQLQYVDLSQNTKLKALNIICSNNIETLDLSNNLNLETLYALRSPLSSDLDLSHNTNLKEIHLKVIGSSLDLSAHTVLEKAELYFLEDSVSLDISGCQSLTEIDLNKSSDNPNIVSLNITPPVVSNVKYLTLSSVSLTGQELVQCFPRVETVFSSHGLTGDLDLTMLPYLKNINVRDSNVTSVESHEHSSLEQATFVWGMGIISADFSRCASLKKVSLESEYLISLGIDNNLQLEEAHIQGPLEILSFDNCSALKWLTYAPYNDNTVALSSTTPTLETLSLSGCYNLKTVVLQRMLIEALDLSARTNLITLYVTDSQYLSSLNIRGCSALIDLDITDDPLDIVNISSSEWLCKAHNNGARTRSQHNDHYHIVEHITLPVDGGSYQIYLKHNEDTVINDGIIKIISQTSSPQSVLKDDDITLFVETTGGEEVNYSWEYYDTEHDIWTTIEGATNSQYIIEQIDETYDNMSFRCKFYSEDYSATCSPILLLVDHIPIVTGNPASVTVMEGHSTTFAVQAIGHGLSYQWQVSTDNTVWNDIRYATEPNYELLAAMSMNGYAYRCVVTNDLGDTTSDAATLTVIPDPSLTPPLITEQPSSQQVSDGDIATFSIVASGENLAYQWQTLKDGIWYSISGANAASYSVGASRLLNNAQYRCQVSNPIGSIYSDVVRLSVTSGSDISTPSIQIQPRSVTVADGTAAMFATSASGGSLYFQWQVKRNGQWYDITGATNSIYTVVARSSMNGEQYRCQITNSAGTVYTNIVQLTVQSSAPLEFYGYHSLIISGKNTYGEWEMYPTSRPHVAPPEVKTSYVDVPGANGGLDYTDLLTGDPRYGYRKGSWEFLLIPQEKWPDVYRSLCNFLHGKVHTVVLEDDPTWQYTGRLSVNQWQSAAHNSLITIDYILDPIPVNLEDEAYDQDADDLALAARILRKSANEGKVIALVNNQAMLTYPEDYFEDGDEILY